MPMRGWRTFQCQMPGATSCMGATLPRRRRSGQVISVTVPAVTSAPAQTRSTFTQPRRRKPTPNDLVDDQGDRAHHGEHRRRVDRGEAESVDRHPADGGERIVRLSAVRVHHREQHQPRAVGGRHQERPPDQLAGPSAHPDPARVASAAPSFHAPKQISVTRAGDADHALAGGRPRELDREHRDARPTPRGRSRSGAASGRSAAARALLQADRHREQPAHRRVEAVEAPSPTSASSDRSHRGLLREAVGVGRGVAALEAHLVRPQPVEVRRPGSPGRRRSRRPASTSIFVSQPSTPSG